MAEYRGAAGVNRRVVDFESYLTRDWLISSHRFDTIADSNGDGFQCISMESMD